MRWRDNPGTVNNSTLENGIYNLVQRRNADRAQGRKHTPLHTIRELLEGTGVTKASFKALTVYHADIAPTPRIVSHRDTHFVKAEFEAFVREVLVRNATAHKGVEFLKSKGYTQMAIADHVGYDRTLFSRFLNGKNISCPKAVMDKISALVREIEDKER